MYKQRKMTESSYEYATPKPQRQRYNLENTFKSLDVEQMGKIRKSILQSAVIYTGDQYNRNIIMNQLDKCDDLITYERFSQIFEMAQQQEFDTSAQWIFKLYDRQQKGFIDRKDLIRASQITGVQLSEQQIQQMLFNHKQVQQQYSQQSQSQQIQGQQKVYYQKFLQIMAQRMSMQN